MVLAILISSLVFFLDSSLFQQIPLLNQVNFLLLVLVALAYQPSRVKPVYLGLYLGFLYDLCFLDSFGFYMLSFFATGFFIQSLISYFNSNSFVSAILTGIFSFLFYQLFTGIFHQLLGTGLATENGPKAKCQPPTLGPRRPTGTYFYLFKPLQGWEV